MFQNVLPPFRLRIAPVPGVVVVELLLAGSLCAAKGYAPMPSMSTKIEWRTNETNMIFFKRKRLKLAITF